MKKLTVYSVVLALVVLVFGLTANAALLVEDTFNRSDSNTVGDMSDGSHSWYEYEALDDDVIVNGTALYTRTSGEIGVAVNNFTLADGIIKVRNTYRNGGDFHVYTGGAVNYRATEIARGARSACSGAYHLRISKDWSGNQDIGLYYGGMNLRASANISSAWAAFDLVVQFEGNSHKVYVDNVLVIDFTETTAGRTDAGFLGLGSYSDRVRFDNFQVWEIPEPATMSLLVLGLPLVLRRRKK